MADPPVDTTKGGKLAASFKKHKAAWIIGSIVGIVIIYFLIRFYSGNNQNANQAAAQNGNLTSSGIAGTGPIDLTGSQGPPGPPGPPGKRGRRGPPGKPGHHKKPPHHHRAVNAGIVPQHMLPSHTSGNSHHVDASHAVKSREINAHH